MDKIKFKHLFQRGLLVITVSAVLFRLVLQTLL